MCVTSHAPTHKRTPTNYTLVSSVYTVIYFMWVLIYTNYCNGDRTYSFLQRRVYKYLSTLYYVIITDALGQWSLCH